MAIVKSVIAGQHLMGRLDYDDDLLAALTHICISHNIQSGFITAIGAVQCARVGFYNQRLKSYEYINYEKDMELLSLTGNISMKEGKPMVHAHVVLGDENGHAFGGHLANETKVFACEFMIKAFSEPVFHRQMDAATGLALFSKE